LRGQNHAFSGDYLDALSWPSQRGGDVVSNHSQPTVLSVLDRALGSQKRTARLIWLIVATTCCLVVVLLTTVLALSGGHFVLSVGLGASSMLLLIAAAIKKYRKWRLAGH
jgi:hypothetical protein